MIKIPQDKSIETRKPSIRLESSHSLTDTTVSEILAQAYLSMYGTAKAGMVSVLLKVYTVSAEDQQTDIEC